jgi:outer membrane protein
VFATGLAAFDSAPALAKSKGDLLVRVRAMHVNPDAEGTTNVGGSAEVDSSTMPELDFTYFFTDNIAVELVLATTRHDVMVNGVADLGEVSLIPPVLALQYHFLPKQKVSPYVGAGINYTILKGRWSLNFDIKKVWMDTDISVNSGTIVAPDTDINPWIISFGVGYRF